MQSNQSLRLEYNRNIIVNFIASYNLEATPIELCNTHLIIVCDVALLKVLHTNETKIWLHASYRTLKIVHRTIRVLSPIRISTSSNIFLGHILHLTRNTAFS